MVRKRVKKSELTRQSLLKSASKLFATQGYSETGVDQIASEIGLTSGVFYANYRSKEDLLKLALKRQIEFSKKRLLDLQPGETAVHWAHRVLAFYLSPDHRDSLEESCPLTTLSEEFLKKGLIKKTGLGKYLNEFQSVLKMRLESIQSGLGSLAPALISICVGAVQLSRLIKNRAQSDEYLIQTKKTATELIFGKKNSKRGLDENR